MRREPTTNESSPLKRRPIGRRMQVALERRPQWERDDMDTVEVTVELPRSILAVAGVREPELDALLRESLAVDLYRRGQISLGKAAEVAGVATRWEMIAVL